MTSENRKLARKRDKQKRKRMNKDVKNKIKEATDLLLTQTKCFDDNCDKVFDFKTSNHDEWFVRSYENKTILLCQECAILNT